MEVEPFWGIYASNHDMVILFRYNLSYGYMSCTYAEEACPQSHLATLISFLWTRRVLTLAYPVYLSGTG